MFSYFQLSLHLFLGYYSNGTGASTCLECPEKYECLNSPSQPAPCRQGSFCRKGNHQDSNNGLPVECPEGTFGASKYLHLESECTPCLAGRYCEGKGLTNYTGSCAAGYWCKTGAKTRNPPDEAQKHGKCPKGGYYCPEGTEDPQKCSPGRYAPDPKNMLKSMDECDFCPPGKFCETGSQSTPSGDCSEGYYCMLGSPTKEPNSTYGDICPSGTYCPAGSSRPTPCPAGTYNALSQQASCKWCPPGFYCPANTTQPQECPAGYWCENGTETAHANPCPPGTFNNLRQQSQRLHCVVCTPGSYCQQNGRNG